MSRYPSKAEALAKAAELLDRAESYSTTRTEIAMAYSHQAEVWARIAGNR